jgi:hypothetical protein
MEESKGNNKRPLEEELEEEEEVDSEEQEFDEDGEEGSEGDDDDDDDEDDDDPELSELDEEEKVPFNNRSPFPFHFYCSYINLQSWHNHHPWRAVRV